jgi:1-acyl-sn-glycerol-3-phosphate acyltransferase
MVPEGTRSADGQIHEFKSGAGFLALRSRCDVLPVLIRGTHDVMGKGSLIPRRHPVEVRIGRAITAAEIRELADSSEVAGAYRRLADLMRDSVIALAGTRRRSKMATLKALPAPSSIPEPSKPADNTGRRSGEHPRGHEKA